MSAAKLYTPEVLQAAVTLAQFPLAPDLPLIGQARSQSCGSSLRIGLALSASGAIERIGLAASACAIGQASAAIFAGSAVGRTPSDIADARDALRLWLCEKGEMPEWAGLDLIAPARAYPARHGAIMLAWDAAIRALEGADAS